MADYYFNKQIEYSEDLIDLNRPYAQSTFAHLNLAGSLAFQGEKKEAMEILRYIHQRPFVAGTCAFYIQVDPLFESLRNDPEFQQIEKDLVERNQNKQAEIRQWLEENEML